MERFNITASQFCRISHSSYYNRTASLEKLIPGIINIIFVFFFCYIITIAAQLAMYTPPAGQNHQC